MRQVLFDPQAVQDLEDIRDYLVELNPDAAEAVRVDIMTRLHKLRDAPLSGKATDFKDVRVLYPIKYPYRIYYRVRGDVIIVLHIRHTSRKLPDLDQLV
jgi:toxin ParE1/3/4